MIVRIACEADFESWLPLWKAYQQFYKTDISENTTVVTWTRFLDADEPMHCAVAEVDEKIVGLVHYIQHRSCWTVGDYWYLQDLFVAMSARGQGAGRALIKFVYARAQESGASRVWWLTHETNTDAMQLYNKISEKSGFVQYRRIF
jgi:GNAT superfamily N-acetyltransferase